MSTPEICRILYQSILVRIRMANLSANSSCVANNTILGEHEELAVGTYGVCKSLARNSMLACKRSKSRACSFYRIAEDDLLWNVSLSTLRAHCPRSWRDAAILLDVELGDVLRICSVHLEVRAAPCVAVEQFPRC